MPKQSQIIEGISHSKKSKVNYHTKQNHFGAAKHHFSNNCI